MYIFFPHPPTPLYIHLTTLHTHLHTILSGRGGPLEGFIRPLHRPSPRGAVDLPSTPSVHPVDYRLDLYSYLHATADIRKINATYVSGNIPW